MLQLWQQFWILDNGPGDGDPLLLAAAQFPGETVFYPAYPPLLKLRLCSEGIC